MDPPPYFRLTPLPQLQGAERGGLRRVIGRPPGAAPALPVTLAVRIVARNLPTTIADEG